MNIVNVVVMTNPLLLLTCFVIDSIKYFFLQNMCQRSIVTLRVVFIHCYHLNGRYLDTQFYIHPEVFTYLSTVTY